MQGVLGAIRWVLERIGLVVVRKKDCARFPKSQLNVLEILKFRDRNEFLEYKSKVVSPRLAVERLICEKHRTDDPNYTWTVPGYSEPVEKAVDFIVSWAAAWSDVPNYREVLVCPETHLRNRQRFVVGQLKRLIRQRSEIRDIYLYDQITPLFHYVHSTFRQCNVTGSEYLGFDKKPGDVINGIRHEDALNLSFRNDSLDIIVSTDVLEHVQDVGRAIAEAYRVLRPGGVYLFSVPLRHDKAKTDQRARLLPDGTVEHLLMPEKYHPSPVDPKGSLVFYDFGWDILDMFRSAGFQDAYVMGYYDLLFGYIGEGIQIAFCAEK